MKSRPAVAQCLCLGLIAAACLFGPPARAQQIMEFAQTYHAPMSNFISNSFLNQELLINATRENAARTAHKPLPLAAPQVERNAAELAQAVPAAQRAKLETIYIQLMPLYHQLEQKLGWASDDLPGAIAALIAGNYMAMTGTEPSDASVIAAAQQLRSSGTVQDQLARLDPADRRRLYEQCAMLGSFMAAANQTSAQQSKQVLANLRHAARENLRVVLGKAAERLRFTEQGMAFD